MKLEEFISDALDQMKNLQNNSDNKKKYYVKELEFELSLTTTNTGQIGVNFLGIDAGTNSESQNDQKVIIRLVPKSSVHNDRR